MQIDHYFTSFLSANKQTNTKKKNISKMSSHVSKGAQYLAMADKSGGKSILSSTLNWEVGSVSRCLYSAVKPHPWCLDSVPKGPWCLSCDWLRQPVTHQHHPFWNSKGNKRGNGYNQVST